MVPEILEKSGKVYGDKPIYGKKYLLGDSVKGKKIPAYYFGEKGAYFVFFSEGINEPMFCYKCRKDKPLVNTGFYNSPYAFKISSKKGIESRLERDFISETIKVKNLKNNL